MQAQPRRALFNRDHARTLTRVQITETSPGTILHDFDVLLDMLRQAPMPVSKVTQRPSRSLLPQINARLANPVQLGLKNPQLKSYPPIMGLYLLLRASGLTTVGGTSQKPRLFLDADLDSEWQTLNPVERYGSLLDTWLLRASPEILSERPQRGFLPDSYLRWAQMLTTIPDDGLQATPDENFDSVMKYSLGWHNLGIMELFGLLAVVSGPPQPGQGWQIATIRRTPFGDALIALLIDKYFSRLDPFRMLQGDDFAEAGALQPILEPYWPQWKRTLRVPDWTFRPGTHVFSMQLHQLQARLALPADATLDHLASTILHVLRFDFDHLYEFTYRNRLGVTDTVCHPMMDETPTTEETRIGDLPLAAGQTMTFIYDFGDWWEIPLMLEAVDTGLAIAKPTVLEKKGRPPSQY